MYRQKWRMNEQAEKAPGRARSLSKNGRLFVVGEPEGSAVSVERLKAMGLVAIYEVVEETEEEGEPT